MQFFKFKKTDKEDTVRPDETPEDHTIQSLSENDLEVVVGGVGPMVILTDEGKANQNPTGMR